MAANFSGDLMWETHTQQACLCQSELDGLEYYILLQATNLATY